MMNEENQGCCGGGECHSEGHMCGTMKKEFKMAMLDKKEKILEAELDFVKKMKELVKKAMDEKEGK